MSGRPSGARSTVRPRPRSLPRLRNRWSAVLVGAVAALPLGPHGALADAPAIPPNLACVLKAVQTGQFQRLDYISGPVGGSIALSVVLSPADVAADRGVIIGDERAGVAALVMQPGETLLVDTGATDDLATLSLFTRDRQDDAIPAAYSRQRMVGHIPLVSQYTGICKPP